MLENFVLSTPTFGDMQMRLVDSKQRIYVAECASKQKVTYDREDEMLMDDALDLFWEELLPEAKEKIMCVFVPDVDQIIGENRLEGFGNENNTRVRNSYHGDKGEMWWTSTSGVAKYTHFLVDINGGLISDENDRRSAGFVPAVKLKSEVRL